jgi:hypothetical protein
MSDRAVRAELVQQQAQASLERESALEAKCSSMQVRGTLLSLSGCAVRLSTVVRETLSPCRLSMQAKLNAATRDFLVTSQEAKVRFL